MKKVFSVKKYEEAMKKNGSEKEQIEFSKELWANKFDELTEDEIMEKYGCFTHDNWMIEVEEGGNK